MRESRWAIVVPGQGALDPEGTYTLSPGCNRVLSLAAELAENRRPSVVVLSGWAPYAGESEASQMLGRLAGPARPRAPRRGHRHQHVPEHGPRVAAPSDARCRRGNDRLRAGPSPALPLLLRRRLSTLRRVVHVPFSPPAPECRCTRVGGGRAHRHAMAEAKRGRGARAPGEFAQVQRRRADTGSVRRPGLFLAFCLLTAAVVAGCGGTAPSGSSSCRACFGRRAERCGSRSRCLRGRRKSRERPFRARRDGEREWPRSSDDRRRPGEASLGGRRKLGRAGAGREAGFLRAVLRRRRPGESPGALHPLPATVGTATAI